MRYPKFEEKLKRDVIGPATVTGAEATYGLIITYNAYSNTATVLSTHPGSDEPGITYYNVPCPMQKGVQTVDPLPGTTCWISFKDNSTWFPMVTNYFSHIYQDMVYTAQSSAANNVPKYLYSM